MRKRRDMGRRRKLVRSKKRKVKRSRVRSKNIRSCVVAS